MSNNKDLLGETHPDDYSFAEEEDSHCSGLENFPGLTQIYEQDTAAKYGL